MISVPLTVRFFVATGTAAVLVGCSSGPDGAGPGTATTDRTGGTTSATVTTPPSADAGAQGYLDQVDGLCDTLLSGIEGLPRGGSLDVSATQYLAEWPAHQKLLDGFDADLAAVSAPPEAADAEQALTAYVTFADALDAARLQAAHQGEDAWRAEVASETDVESDPAITGLHAAGFAESCEAR